MKAKDGRLVVVSYSLNKYWSHGDHYDRAILRLAKRHKGKQDGSGAGVGERDISLDFSAWENAKKFEKDVKAFFRGESTRVRVEQYSLE